MVYRDILRGVGVPLVYATLETYLDHAPCRFVCIRVCDVQSGYFRGGSILLKRNRLSWRYDGGGVIDGFHDYENVSSSQSRTTRRGKLNL